MKPRDPQSPLPSEITPEPVYRARRRLLHVEPADHARPRLDVVGDGRLLVAERGEADEVGVEVEDTHEVRESRSCRRCPLME